MTHAAGFGIVSVMPDTTPEASPTPPVALAAPEAPAASAVSPTGQAVVPQYVARAAVILFGIAGAIAMAPAAGIDIGFLPPLVPKVSALVAFVAATLGLVGPGIRKVSP